VALKLQALTMVHASIFLAGDAGKDGSAGSITSHSFA
jgi:hypothetical protein